MVLPSDRIFIPQAKSRPQVPFTMHFLPILLLLTILSPSLSQFCNNRPFHRSKLGNSSLTILTDGPLLLTSNPFVTVPYAAVKRSYRTSFRPTDPIVAQQNVLVFDTPTKRILFDTGAFNTPQLGDLTVRAGKLSRHLKRAKIDPDSIDAVVLTHAHADHSAGLIDKAGRLAFKNAKVYIGRIEHEFWTSDPFPKVPTGLDQETLQGLASGYLPAIAPYLEARKVVFVEDGETPLPGVKFMFSPGHSPGHMALEISSDGEIMLVIGDAWISQPDQVQNPEWGFSPETDRETAYQSRIKLLERVARKRERVLVYHEQFPGLGYVQKVGPAFGWGPEAGITFGDDFCEK